MKHRLSFLFGKIPLQTALIVPFVVQILATVGIVGVLSFRNGQRAVNDVASQLRREVSERIQQKLLDYSEIPHLLNRINADAVRRGELTTQDRASERYLWQQIQHVDSVAWIYYGAQADGSFIGVTQDPEAGILAVINDSTSQFQGYYFALDEQGRREERIRITPDIYDSRTRPWYQTAQENGDSSWSSIYPSVGIQQLILSAVLPVYDQANQLTGVVGVDYALDDISRFLEGLQIGKTGEAFIMESSGLMVASSVEETPYRVQETESGTSINRFLARDSQDPLIQATVAILTQAYDLEGLLGQAQVDLEFEGETYFVQVSPFMDGRGLQWLVVVVIPESDFMAQINANTLKTAMLCGVALVIAIGFGLLTSRWINSSTQQLSQAARVMAGGKLDQRVQVSGIRELQDLAQAFNQMGQQLQHSFQALETTNSELEQRVEERTQELQQANDQILMLNQRLQTENHRLSTEMDIARQLQQRILPKHQELNQIPELDISGHMDVATEVGGDYYDVVLQQGNLKIGIGDVTGHGLDSGVLMLMVQTAVRTLLESDITDPEELLQILNRVICYNVQRMDSDKTLSLSLLEYNKGRLSLSGQHEELILVRNSGEVERVNTIDLGFPIGLEPDIREFVDQVELQMHPGDVVILYTDGITEAENVRGEFYGLEQLCEIVRHHRQQTADQIRQAVIEDVYRHIGDHKVFDDITLLVLKQK